VYLASIGSRREAETRLFDPPSLEEAGIGSVLLDVGGVALLGCILYPVIFFRGVALCVRIELGALGALIAWWDGRHFTHVEIPWACLGQQTVARFSRYKSKLFPLPGILRWNHLRAPECLRLAWRPNHSPEEGIEVAKPGWRALARVARSGWRRQPRLRSTPDCVWLATTASLPMRARPHEWRVRLGRHRGVCRKVESPQVATERLGGGIPAFRSIYTSETTSRSGDCPVALVESGEPFIPLRSRAAHQFATALVTLSQREVGRSGIVSRTT